MAIYRGVLSKMSGGSEVMTARRVYSGGELVDEYQQGTGFTRREFIEVGDQHLRNVVLSNYHDALLVDAVGQEVEISISTPLLFGARRVIAIRRPNGKVAKDGPFRTLFGFVWTIVLSWTLAAIVGGILFFMGLATNLIPLVVLAVAVALLIIVGTFVSSLRTLRAWGAL